jgi:hypothetical protein
MSWPRLLTLVVMLSLLVGAVPLVARAEGDVPRLLEAQLVTPGALQPVPERYWLFVQATSLAGSPHRYVLMIANLSPWEMKGLRVLDRYLALDPARAEVDREWAPQKLAPRQVVAVVFDFPADASARYHQLEITLAEGLGTILVDCNPPGTTTSWRVPLSADLERFFVPPLEPVALSLGSKLGIHVTKNNSPNIMEFVRRAQPAVVVAVGDLGWLSEVKAVSPKTVTVGRLVEGDQSFTGDPVERAREFVAANLGVYRANPGVDYWLGWNEPAISNVEEMRWYAAFEAARAAAMAEEGLKVAVGNFATGTPEADQFEAFLPALAAAKAYGGIFALHEYSAPTLRDGVGAGIPGMEGKGDYGALTLRYRYWYEHYLLPQKLAVPLVVTEMGIDGGVLPSSMGLGGWRDFARVSGLAAPEEDYIAQLSWYDDELRRDPYVLGCAVFNAGDDGRWKSFDITELLPQLADVANSKR